MSAVSVKILLAVSDSACFKFRELQPNKIPTKHTIKSDIQQAVLQDKNCL